MSKSRSDLNTALATKTASTAKLPSNLVLKTPRSLTCSEVSEFTGEVSVSPTSDKTLKSKNDVNTAVAMKTASAEKVSSNLAAKTPRSQTRSELMGEVSVSPAIEKASMLTKEQLQSLESCQLESLSIESDVGKKSSSVGVFVSPLKPMVMTEKDRLKLMRQIKAREEKRQRESTTSSSSGIGLANMENWRGRLSQFKFSERDLLNIEPKAEAPDFKHDSFQWICENRNSLYSDTEKTAKYYKLAFHEEHVTAQLALASMKEMIDHGLLTQEEFDGSVDIAKIRNSSPAALISIQSMSNLVKKMSRERLLGIKI